MRRLTVAVLSFLLLTGCQPTGSEDAAPLSPEAAVAEARQVFLQEVEDWNAGNLDAVLAIVADDVIQMQPNNVIVGKEALSANWRQHLADNTDIWLPTIDEIQAAGNIVFIKVHFTETATPKAGGEPSTMYGEGMTVFRRNASGQWQLVLDQWFEREADM